MKLSSSQQQAVDTAKALFATEEDSPVLLIEGLSGFGKSLVVEEIRKHVREDFRLVVFDSDFETFMIDDREINDRGNQNPAKPGRFSGDDKVVFLSNIGQGLYNWNTEACQPEHRELMEEAGVDLHRLQLTPLNAEEIQEVIRELRPQATDQECELIQSYSHGIPLLVNRMCQHLAPIDEEAAKDIWSLYLVGYLSRSRYLEVSHQALVDILGDVFSLDGLKEIVDHSSYGQASGNMKKLGRGLQRIKHPYPRCPQTMKLYRRDQNLGEITIYTPSLTKEEVAVDLGWRAFARGYTREEKKDSRLAICGADGRKMSAYFSENGEDDEFDAFVDDMSSLYWSLFVEKFPKSLNLVHQKGTTVFQSHDHSGLMGNQYVMGYTTETWLQGEGKEYLVSYYFETERWKGKVETYWYDPQTNTLTRIEE